MHSLSTLIICITNYKVLAVICTIISRINLFILGEVIMKPVNVFEDV